MNFLANPLLQGFFTCLRLNIYLFLAVLVLHCCTQAFSICSQQGLLSSCDVQASFVVEHRL